MTSNHIFISIVIVVATLAMVTFIAKTGIETVLRYDLLTNWRLLKSASNWYDRKHLRSAAGHSALTTVLNNARFVVLGTWVMALGFMFLGRSVSQKFLSLHEGGSNSTSEVEQGRDTIGTVVVTESAYGLFGMASGGIYCFVLALLGRMAVGAKLRDGDRANMKLDKQRVLSDHERKSVDAELDAHVESNEAPAEIDKLPLLLRIPFVYSYLINSLREVIALENRDDSLTRQILAFIYASTHTEPLARESRYDVANERSQRLMSPLQMWARYKSRRYKVDQSVNEEDLLIAATVGLKRMETPTDGLRRIQSEKSLFHEVYREINLAGRNINGTERRASSDRTVNEAVPIRLRRNDCATLFKERGKPPIRRYPVFHVIRLAHSSSGAVYWFSRSAWRRYQACRVGSINEADEIVTEEEWVERLTEGPSISHEVCYATPCWRHFRRGFRVAIRFN